MMALLQLDFVKIQREEGKDPIYTSDDVKEMIAANNMRQSMGASGSCYDNAITETFFHTLKVEAIHGERFDTREELERSIFDYIECFYNTRRKHSALGYLSPESV